MIAAKFLTRVAAMDRAELGFRAASALRREASRVRFAVRRPVWDRRLLAKALRAEGIRFAPAVGMLERGHWAAAHRTLMRHFATRSPRFVIAPSSREPLAGAIRSAFPTATVDAADRASRVLAGSFDLLGYRNLSFAQPDGAIDWRLDPVHKRRAPDVFWSRVPYLDPSTGDHKIIWELNRHQHLMMLGRAYWLSGDARYRRCFVDHLESWMAANPPLSGVNWASMLELAFRSLSWIWSLHFFADADREDDDPWTIDLLLGLDRQLELVQRNLSRYFSPNTHLLGEALALYVAGRVLPELRRSSVWEDVGRRVLVEQMALQIRGDGGHAEGSTHYHRYTLDFYVFALAIAIVTGDSGAAPFADAVRRLARFARSMAGDDGRLPVIGDDDGGALLALSGNDPANVSGSLQIAASLLADTGLSVGAPAEEALWITGKVPSPARPTRLASAALPDSGYYVSRSGRGDHLTFDAGPHGFLNAGHAHADALSITLNVRGRPFLIDPGTACYTIDPAMRDRFRSTPAHNTLTLDDRSQSIPDGPFHWKSTAHARALDWRTDEEFDYVEGAHDGYAPLVHHRAILSRPGVWLIADRVRGTGTHRADMHWHIAPIWNVTAAGKTGVVRAQHPDGTLVWILALDVDAELFRGANGETALGWVAPVYGRLEPTTTIRMRKEGEAPLAFVTAIVESQDQPIMEAVQVIGPGAPLGVKITTASWGDTVIFTRAADEHGMRSDLWRAGNVVTSERLAWWRDDQPPSSSPVDRSEELDSSEALQSSVAAPIPIAAAASETRPMHDAR
ncbi:MAG TPA: alginate lyase family protein [Vicinamibacterales bacterium]